MDFNGMLFFYNTRPGFIQFVELYLCACFGDRGVILVFIGGCTRLMRPIPSPCPPYQFLNTFSFNFYIFKPKGQDQSPKYRLPHIGRL